MAHNLQHFRGKSSSKCKKKRKSTHKQRQAKKGSGRNKYKR